MWSHAQMCLLGVTTFKFNIFPYFSKKRENWGKCKQFQAKMVKHDS